MLPYVKSARFKFVVMTITMVILLSCHPGYLYQHRLQQDQSVSLAFHHFEDGVLFVNPEDGLNVLWQASFIGRRSYKENLAFFVAEGLLILPNKHNTRFSARLRALPLEVIEGKLWVSYRFQKLEVLAIIHPPRSYELAWPCQSHRLSVLLPWNP